VARLDLPQRRFRLGAGRDRVAAAGGEAAAVGRVQQARHRAGDRLEPPVLGCRQVEARMERISPCV
jgi:hypothetical protein